ncbi:unnamed protein product [Rotaria magnacalcarata]|uniref:Uncharacterized protein n=1 Tax=Rotaria magnacalcarata TaxID=392030 RepID=A0A816MLT4_9BILA|nr:unnamed protein product [Rotaria magnacalcarata]CAF1483641.1 unnamed protein product [Rotaria magnacalcarata]CAF1987655.1 unnamed protein product [Rotaria magnacalcarata]CAF2013739.1 unnamed protein product [Rotaria magnacalcarata]CAF2155084.1 unnamed protein product [Rotaria magnacalcarata]
MARFNQSLLYTIIAFLSVLYRITNVKCATDAPTPIVDTSIETPITAESTPTLSSNTTTVLNNSTSTGTTTTTKTSTLLSTTTTTTSMVISVVTNGTVTTDSNATRPPDERSGPGWWLLVALLITIIIVIIAGVIFYYRQKSPYRRSISCSQWCRQCNTRFLRNWRSHDDGTDNIILQLEQSDMTNDHWPPRISFT